MRLFLLDVKVLAFPDVSGKVAEHCRVVMVTTAAECRSLPKLASAHDATESLTLGRPDEGGAAPKRGAVIFDQTT